MSRLSGFKRIIVEDHKEADRDLVGKLAYPINTFADEVLNALDKGLSIDDNLNIVKKTILTTVDPSGKPTTPLTITSGLTSTCVGMQVIKAINKTNPSISPDSTPFITFSDNGGSISISKITSLTANNQYSLTVILYV